MIMEMTIIMLDIKEIKTMTLARIDQYFFLGKDWLLSRRKYMQRLDMMNSIY